MSSANFRNAVSVAGVGLRQYKRGKAPLPEQGVLIGAIIDACEDAGFAPALIDGFVSYGDDNNEPVRLMSDLGTQELRLNAQMWGGGGGGIAGAFGLAASAIATGQATAVVVFRALVQDNSGRLSAAVMRHHLNDHLIGAGLLSPAQICALRARRLYEFHGVRPSVAEELVRASYYHGSRNPDATAYGQPLDLQAYREGRWIAEPFRLFDCSRENDGAGALLLVSTERARDLRKPPVRLLGVANGTAKGWGDLCENDQDYASAGFKPIARRLWEQTGITPADVDVVQLYENFSAQGVASLIDHGFCNYENAAEFIRFDNLIAPGGGLPVNTAGGNFAHGFVHGIGMAVEAVRVLRGESANPVADAKICLMTGGPGAPTVSSALFSRDDL
ncbi:transporter [Pseudomonas sp. NFACC13-1]|uniref:thiolase C-terminal domain-containing protein n=1 Tax=Pseudomonas sp. NFACC13-1 TaxID=1566245 RepID=UPI000881D23E|nr:transporter [Pseudomonas sp. NFACC13-1]SDB35218.1 Acetyl-CoA acetyltransferase [Pseudomonas sp. NFACC13-1]